MVASKIVKDIIKLPAIFLLLFIIILIIFTLFNLLSIIVSQYTDFSKLTAAIFFNRIPVAALDVLPGAVILGLLAIFLKMSLKPAVNPLVIIIIALLAFGLLTGILIGISPLLSAEEQQQPDPGNYLTAGTINQFGNVALFPDRIDANLLHNSFLIQTGAEKNRLSYHQKIGSAAGRDTIIITLPMEEISIGIVNPYQQYLSRQDAFSADIFRMFRTFSHDLITLARKPGPSLFLICIAFIFFIASSSVFTRITRWPLFNLLMCGIMITGILLLYSLYKTDIYPELVKVMKNTAFLGLVPVIALGGMGVLFILIDIIFIPRKYRQKGARVD